jgi:AsmA protein
MTVALDDSRITGDFTVAGVRNPDYRFALAIDRIDVDRYLPPPASKAQAGAPTAGDIELPAEALGNLKLDGTIKVGRLELANLDLDDVSTAIAVGNGEAHLTNAGAKLYGGRFDGSFDVKTAGAQPGLTLTGKAQSLDLGALIAALTRGPANVSGKGDFDLALTGSGATVIENVKTAGGRVAFSMKDGAIEGFNLGRTLCSVYNSLQKVPGPADQPKVTRYQVISGTADVANGVASSKDLLARAPFMDVTGNGKLGLATQRLDYSVEAKLTGKIDIAGCETMEGLIGESIPLTLRGTVTDPSISPDFSAIIQRRLKNEVKELLQERLLRGLLK